MNPLLNPFTALPVLKNYVLDPGRIQRLNHKQLEKYRDKAFRKIVKYAYTSIIISTKKQVFIQVISKE